MDKYINFILNKPKTFVIIIIIITVILFPGILKLKFENSMKVMHNKGDKEYAFFKKIQNTFGNSGKFILLDIFGDDTLWNSKSFKEIDHLISDIEEYKDFNKELENTRLEKFNLILAEEKISYKNILIKFSDDNNFLRLLKRKINKLFGDIEILLKHDLEILGNELLKTYSIKSKERIKKIISPFTVQDVKGEMDTLMTFDLIEKDENGNRILPVNKDEFNKLRENLLKTPFFEKGIYSRDKVTGEITDFAVYIRLDAGEKFNNITGEIIDITTDYDGINILSTGIPVINNRFSIYLREDLRNFFPLIFIILIVAFYFNFKSLRGIILPFITLLLSDIWTFGLMGHLGYKITLVSVILPSLLMAIGSSYSIHILNQYYIDFSLITNKGKKDGLKLSMSHISITVLLAGLTTFFGFISLTSNNVPGLREFAMFSAIGIIFCVLITITIFPVVLLLLPHGMPKIMLNQDSIVKKTIVDRIIANISLIVTRHYGNILTVVAVVIIVSVIGIFKVSVESNIINTFKEDDNIRASVRIVGEKFGGGKGINIIIDSGEEDGVIRPDFLKKIEDFREWLISDKNIDLSIGRTDFFSDYIKKMNMAMNNDDISFYKIPDTYEDIADYLELFSGEDSNSDGRVDVFEPYVDQEFRTANVFARLHNIEGKAIGTGEVKYTINKIKNYLQNKFNASCRITGGRVLFINLSKYIVQGQITSLVVCLAIVVLTIILLFKNLWAGMFALIPMSAAVIINFGIMGWFGISLDISTAIIASITIGIGVDDTIHFLNTFRNFRDRGLSIDQAIQKTLSITGRAIIYTSIVLVFSFSSMMVSNLKPNIYFGLLVAITMIATTFGALIILPSAIKATGMSLDESKSDYILWRYLNIGRFFGFVEQEEDGISS